MRTNMTSCDVVVIGAGLSGLSAARAVHEAGKSVVVLEARDRVGGKTRSISTTSGGRVDLGAAWVNEHTMPMISGLAVESGNALVKQSIVGKASMELGPGYKLDYQDTGRIDQTHIPFEPADGDNFLKINMLLVELCSDLPTSHADAAKDSRIRQHDNITLSAWLDRPEVGARPHIKVALMSGMHALLGVEMEEVPLSYLMHYAATAGGWLPLITNDESGAQYQRTRDGTQGISIYLASLLPEGSVKLESPVQSIYQDTGLGSGKVTITTRSGQEYTAKQVICTIPSPLYGSVSWSPLLPPPHQALAQRAFLGILGKCIAIYSKPWWREAGWSGTHQSSEGPISVIFDTCDGDLVDLTGSSSSYVGARARQFSLTGFIAGRNAVSFFAPDQSEDDRRRRSLDQLSRLFNDHPDARRPAQLIFENWADEEFSQGAPCPILATGALSNYGQYYGKRHGQVWFAGTEYSEVWKGYMEGAVTSGRKVSGEVLQALSL